LPAVTRGTSLFVSQADLTVPSGIKRPPAGSGRCRTSHQTPPTPAAR